MSGRQIQFDVNENTLVVDSGFKGVAQLIINNDGIQYTIRIVLL